LQLRQNMFRSAPLSHFTEFYGGIWVLILISPWYFQLQQELNALYYREEIEDIRDEDIEET
jgi:hypothetical protein